MSAGRHCESWHERRGEARQAQRLLIARLRRIRLSLRRGSFWTRYFRTAYFRLTQSRNARSVTVCLGPSRKFQNTPRALVLGPPILAPVRRTVQTRRV